MAINVLVCRGQIKNIRSYVINYRTACTTPGGVMQNRGVGFHARGVCADAFRQAFRDGAELRQSFA